MIFVSRFPEEFVKTLTLSKRDTLLNNFTAIERISVSILSEYVFYELSYPFNINSYHFIAKL